MKSLTKLTELEFHRIVITILLACLFCIIGLLLLNDNSSIELEPHITIVMPVESIEPTESMNEPKVAEPVKIPVKILKPVEPEAEEPEVEAPEVEEPAFSAADNMRENFIKSVCVKLTEESLPINSGGIQGRDNIKKLCEDNGYEFDW